MSQPTPPPANGRGLSWLNAVKGLTLTNVLVIALLVPVLGAAYLLYKSLNDPAIMDRLLSTYEERPDQSGCFVRHVKERAGPDMWSVSTGFAVAGVDRWFVSVIVPHAPTAEEVLSYCESAKLLADRLVDNRHDDGGNATGP